MIAVPPSKLFRSSVSVCVHRFPFQTESMEAGKKWGQDLAEKVIERLRKNGYKTSA